MVRWSTGNSQASADRAALADKHEAIPFGRTLAIRASFESRVVVAVVAMKFNLNCFGHGRDTMRRKSLGGTRSIHEGLGGLRARQPK
jgi:hypothetical protein